MLIEKQTHIPQPQIDDRYHCCGNITIFSENMPTCSFFHTCLYSPYVLQVVSTKCNADWHSKKEGESASQTHLHSGVQISHPFVPHSCT
jgi:hypothetical protein